MSHSFTPFTKIHIFHSINDLVKYVEDEASRWKSLHEEYSVKLGRNMRTEGSKNESSSSVKNLPSDKKKKQKKSTINRDWVSVEGLMVFRGDYALAEAEILFDAVDDIRAKIENLEKSSKALKRVAEKGSMGEASILAYIKNGVLDKVAFKPTGEKSNRPRFVYSSEFNLRK
ncbi:MAG: hypothetical protein ACE5PO_02150 [Candidatus Bathyarchaeia archaeon]